MADNLLYFPYINLPDSPWTMRTLLYYNTVSAIVPKDFIYENNKFDPFMRTLVKENLVIPLDPTRVLQRIWELDAPFIQFITSPGFNIEKRRKDFQDKLTQNSSVSPSFINREKFKYGANGPSLISKEKFSYSLIDRIEEFGLARVAFDNFYYVEERTASYLMAYLSNIVAKKQDLLPATNSKMKLTGRLSYHGKMLDEQINNRRNNVLKGIIPMPAGLNLTKLLDFKYKYKRELSIFKNIVEQIALDERYSNEELLQQKIEELIYHKEVLAEQMDKSRLGEIVFGSVCGLVGATIGIATTGSWPGALLGTPAFANSVYSALKLENPENIPDTTGMKYLALIDRKIR